MSSDRPSRMKIAEICRRLELGEVAVYQMLREGILPAVKLGRRWIVTREAFEEWLRTCGRQSA